MWTSLYRAFGALTDSERDFNLAAQRIQAALLTVQVPAIAGLDIGVRASPARQVGGDYIDLFPVSYTHLDVYKRQGIERTAHMFSVAAAFAIVAAALGLSHGSFEVGGLHVSSVEIVLLAMALWLLVFRRIILPHFVRRLGRSYR